MLLADISQHSTELVLINSVKRIGSTFKDGAGALANPAVLSLEIDNIDGTQLLLDTYLPVADRDPDPPRIINPSTGVFEFPFGLDNGSTDVDKTNKTNQSTDYLFIWRANQTSGSQSYITIDPLTGPNALLKWTAVSPGTPGDFIKIQYVDPGTPNSTLEIIRTGSLIQVSLATDALANITTIANDIIPAVVASEEASEIVTVALASGSTGTDLVAAVAATNLDNGVDASTEEVIYTNVKILPHVAFSILGKFRLLIDKTMKLIDNDPGDPCYLGYDDGQLIQYLDSGLQIINSYQPYGTFTWYNFPYGSYDFILLETSLIAGMMSQSMYAIDTDIPQWNDQGTAFVITHYTQLAQHLNMLTQRLDKMIPQFKLHFIQSGSLHIQAGANYRLAQLIAAAPSGSLFRNLFIRVE